MDTDLKNRHMETERLILRNFESKDSADCLAFLSDYETCMADGGYPPLFADSEDYKGIMTSFEAKKDRYMIELKSNHRVIGTVNFTQDSHRAVKTYEIGYVIAPGYRRKGYAYEAVSHLIDVFFETTDVEMFLASAYAFNQKSISLLRKLGFKQEGICHHAVCHREYGITDVYRFYLEK